MDGRAEVAALQPLVREVFEISRFTLLFTVFPSVREALAALSRDARRLRRRRARLMLVRF
jgi:hypothetical protein